jgi:hypothetical protein
MIKERKKHVKGHAMNVLAGCVYSEIGSSRVLTYTQWHTVSLIPPVHIVHVHVHVYWEFLRIRCTNDLFI